MTLQNISLLLTTGTIGVGKTSVADEMFEILSKQAQPVALINLDELGYANPRPEDDPLNKQLRLKNLASIWPNYIEAGVKFAIVPYVIENHEELEEFCKTVPGAQVSVVLLNASGSILEKRIRNRLMGGSLEWNLNRAQELDDILKKANIEDVVVNTEDKTIPQAAEEVIVEWKKLITNRNLAK